jgi:hypothetical protein
MRCFDSIRSGDLGHMKKASTKCPSPQPRLSSSQMTAQTLGWRPQTDQDARAGLSRGHLLASLAVLAIIDTGNDEVAIPASRLDDPEWRALLRSPVRVRKRIGFRQLDNSGRARRPVRQRGPASLDPRGCGLIGLFAAEARFVSPFSVWSTPEGGDRARRRVSNRLPGPGRGRAVAALVAALARHLRAVGPGPEGSEQTRLAVT